MLIVDSNNILSIGEQLQEGKQFTRSFFGYPMIAYDHTVLVYHKKEVIQKQWKDIGAGQYILQLHRTPEQNEAGFNKGLARIGFDILFKYDEEKGETINIAKPDTSIIEFADSTFGTSRSALVMPSYDGCLGPQSLPSFLFGIALGHGNWTIKNESLYPVKIAIPLTSSLLGKKEFFEKMASVLHSLHIVHTIQFIHSGNYEVMQLTLHDPALLNQFSQWLNPIVKIAKISTLENTQKVYDTLVNYASDLGLELPFKSYSDLIILEAD